MSDSWMESPEAAQTRRNNEADARLADEDLQRVVSTPEGFRLLLRLLERWGAERGVSSDGLTLRNEAEDLLAQVARVSPATCLRLLAALRGILTAC